MLEAAVTVDPSDQIGTIDPRIYGHFIEHLGRCITGGIWGEMLRSRRFAGFDDDHNGLADPWKKVPARAPQLLVEPPAGIEGGRLAMRCLRDTQAPHQIAHPGLAVRRGEEYSVEVEVTTSRDIREVQIELAGDRIEIPAPGRDGERIEWIARARWDSDDAALTLGCRGEGVMEVRAPSVMLARDRATGGYRADVIELVRAISPPVIRWPGGCFADGYCWRDGVGDRAERPARFDPAWDAWDDNDFGTEEFVGFCRTVGAEPYICVNTGSADTQAAADWVEYCRERELGVRYWGVGNETYGSWEIGNISASDYAHLFLDFAEAMLERDPEIELIAVGADPVDHAGWNRTVLDVAGAKMDHLSVHRYVPHTRDDEQRDRQYRAIVAAPVDVERRLRMVAETIDTVCGSDSDIRIAFDEWNVWLDAGRDILIEERYELRDALFAAGIFNAMHRIGDRLSMGNLAQLVNVLPAITTTQTEAWGTAVYAAFELYRRCGTRAVTCSCDGPSFDSEAFGNVPAMRSVPWVDAVATLSDGGDEVAVAIVNRHPSEDCSVKVQFAEAVEGRERATLCGATERAENTSATPRAVAVDVAPFSEHGESISVRLPAHSATIITMMRGESGVKIV